MNRVAVQFLDQGLHRVLFDAMPLPVFVVDQDVNVLECNAAAARLFKPGVQTGKQHKAGEVLHCLHTTESPKGCDGATACSDCGLRAAVRAASQGQSVTRQRVEMELIRRGRPIKVELRISCQPFTYDRSAFVLLVLEGLNE
ncbi:MAG TPA: PAS domain-containing protein [Candidatus Sulfopaludibacter sp.]|nr:PAS domain-containing protein [Candidatus Sulfopaludibacter sp.]